jgi:CBS domain-containing protein
VPIPQHFLTPPRTAGADTTARDAARLMQTHHVGYLVVVEEGRAAGIVTDRDLALHVLGGELDPGRATIAGCTSRPLITLRSDQGLPEASRLMRRHRIRRLPIVDGEGRLAGVVLADQLVRMIGREVGTLADAVQRALDLEAHPPETPNPIFGKE